MNAFVSYHRHKLDRCANFHKHSHRNSRRTSMLKLTPAKVAISLVCFCLCLVMVYSSSEPYRKMLRENRDAKSYLKQLVNEIHNADQINVKEASRHFYEGEGDASREVIPLPVETRQITLDNRQKLEFFKIVQATNPAPKRAFLLSYSQVNHTIEFLREGKIHSVLHIGFWSQDIDWYLVGPGKDLRHIEICRYPQDLLPRMRQWIFSLELNPEAERDALIQQRDSEAPAIK